MAHIALRQGGLCDLHESTTRSTERGDTEQVCNSIAASILIPRERLLVIPAVQQATREHGWTLDELELLSRMFGASTEAVLLRLVDFGKATWALYQRRRVELQAFYADARDRERVRRRDAEGGPSFYVIKARDLGHGYVSAVMEAFRLRTISSSDVADYLDVRFDQIPQLQAALPQ